MSNKQEVISAPMQTLSLANPDEILKFGKVLKHYITTNGLSSEIAGKQYAHVDGWKFAGMNFGLTPIAKKPTKIHKGEYIKVGYHMATIKYKDKNGVSRQFDKEYPFFIGLASDHNAYRTSSRGLNVTRSIRRLYFAYECECEIKRISDQQILGYGHSICSNLESTKVTFDEYAIDSMAQTRAIGKGYRNLIGYVMNAAGFETTPKEEMEEMAEAEILDLAQILHSISVIETVQDLVDFWETLEEKYQKKIVVKNSFIKQRDKIKHK